MACGLGYVNFRSMGLYIHLGVPARGVFPSKDYFMLDFGHLLCYYESVYLHENMLINPQKGGTECG